MRIPRYAPTVIGQFAPPSRDSGVTPLPLRNHHSSDRGESLSDGAAVSIGYGEALRHYAKGMLHQIIDYTRFRAFAGVGVSSVVVSLKKGGSSSIDVLHFADGHILTDKYRLSSTEIGAMERWGVLLSKHLGLLRRLIKENGKLSDVCDAESAFTVSEAYELTSLIHEGTSDDPSVLRFVNTGTIDPFVCLWGIEQTTYLKKRYLRPVVSRSAFEQCFPRRYQQTCTEKILLSGMRHFEAVYDRQGEWIAGKSTVALRRFRGTVRPLALLGILNSQLITFFLKESFGSLGMDGGITFTPSNVKDIPIPSKTSGLLREVEDCSLRIIERLASAPMTKWDDLRKELDATVYRLYGLSEAEIAAVEVAGVEGRKGQRRRATFETEQ